MNAYYIMAYLALLTFITGLTVRIVRLLKVPPQDRWKLYPLPQAWRRRDLNISRKAQASPERNGRYPLHIGAVIGEDLFLTSLRRHNVKLWRGSVALHLGIYLLVIESILILYTLVLHLLEVQITMAISTAIRYCAWSGYGSALAGTAIILQQRLSRQTLRPFSTAGHYFNLILLGALSATGLAWALLYSDYALIMQQLVNGLVHPTVRMATLPKIGQEHLGLLLFFLFYNPFSHMTHGLIRFFIRREVRHNQSHQQTGKLEARLTPRAQREISNLTEVYPAGPYHSNWNDTGTDTDREK
jgi:nitrate reductase gamma subunit